MKLTGTKQDSCHSDSTRSIDSFMLRLFSPVIKSTAVRLVLEHASSCVLSQTSTTHFVRRTETYSPCGWFPKFSCIYITLCLYKWWSPCFHSCVRRWHCGHWKKHQIGYQIIQMLATRFSIKDLGNLSYFLGIEVTHTYYVLHLMQKNIYSGHTIAKTKILKPNMYLL